MNKFHEFYLFYTRGDDYVKLIDKLESYYTPSGLMDYGDLICEINKLIFNSYLLYHKREDVLSTNKKYKIGTEFHKELSAGFDVILRHTPFGKYFTYEKDTGILKIRDDIDIEEYIEFMKYMSENMKGNVIPYIVPTADEIRQIKEELRNQQ